MKLPNFTADSPDLFFLLMEAALTQQGITSIDKKFLYTLMQCPQRVQIQAKSLINSTASNKMDQLKAIVDNLYALPVEQRLKQLLATTSMGDMKPSEYLHHIRDLQGAGADPNSPLIRTYFIQSLPSNIAPFIHLMQNNNDLDAIAAAADKSLSFCKLQQQQTSVNAISTTPDPQIVALTEQINAVKFRQQSTPDLTGVIRGELAEMRAESNRKFEAMQAQLNAMQQQITFLQSQHRFDYGQFDRRRSRSRGPGRGSFSSHSGGSNFRTENSSNQEQICYYHRKFGQNATKCSMPCNFSGNA
ncbi:MAG: hypothetical protein AAFN81_28260 [Bacteroidota bacterium]